LAAGFNQMAFIWNRLSFRRRPEGGPPASSAGLRGASAPAGISASGRHLPNSNNWAMVMLFGTIAVLYFAREILIPLAFALILTFILAPVVALLERSRIGRVPSVALTVLVTIAAAGCVGGIIAIQFVDVAQELPRYRHNIQAKIDALRIPTTGTVRPCGQQLQGNCARIFQRGGTLSGAGCSCEESESAQCAERSRDSLAGTDRAAGGE
jgi:hypothetical protein